MATTTVDIVVKTLGTNKLDKLDKGLKSVDRTADKIAGSTGRAAKGINKTGNAAKKATGQINGFNKSVRNLLSGLALLSAAKFIFSKTAELERTTKQLATVTGSLEKAKGILSQLQVINKQSPFSFIELADTAKRLSAFGISNEKLVTSTERLGKAAAATGARVNDLALAYGQVAAKGKLQTEELYQFQERGIPLLDELAKGYGKTKAEVQQLITEGRVGFPAVEQAIKNLTTGNGKFAKAFENTADTLDAKLSNAIDSLGRAAAAFGELLKPTVIEALKGLEELLTGITGFLKAIPEPAAKVALQFGAVALQVFAANKALKILVGLKAGVAATLAATSGGLTAAGTAAKVANPFLFKAKALLVSLANIGFITIGVNIVINGLQALAELEKRFNNIANVSSNDFGKLVGGSALSEQEIDKLVKENRDAIQKKTDELGGIRFPILTGKDEALKGEILQLEARYAKLRTMRERAIYATPEDRAAADLERNGNPFELVDGNGKGKVKGAKGATPPKPKTDDLQALQGELDLATQLQPILDEINASRIQGNDDAVRANETFKARLELLNQQQNAVNALNTEEGKTIQRLINEKELRAFNKNALTEESIAARAKATAIEDAMRPLEEQRAILEGTLAGRGEEVRLQLEIERILKGTPGLERAKVEELVRGNAELEKQVEQAAELEQLYAQVGQRVADGLVEGITAAIDGTKDLQEVLADVLKDVGKMFLQFGIKSAFGSLGLPGFAEGGRPDIGKPSIVGEKGPEIFVPDSAGTVLSNDESKAAMARYSPANNNAAVGPQDGGGDVYGSGGAAGAVQTTFKLETTMINGVEYATVDQVRAMGVNATKQGAKAGEAATLRRLQMSPGTRRKIGL